MSLDTSTREPRRLSWPQPGSLAALATKHGKLPVLRDALQPCGIEVVAAPVDTDLFGTFAGDVPRPGTPLETVVAKARAAAHEVGCALGLASEGTFGPHPAAPWAALDSELVALVDVRTDVVVVGRTRAISSTWHSATVARGDDVEAICRRIGVPDQAVIVLPHGSSTPVARALVEPDDVRHAVAEAGLRSSSGLAEVRTDLRAHVNLERRSVIAAAAADLAARLSSLCPSCGCGGWGVESHEAGLACGACGTATSAPAWSRWECPSCMHADVLAVPGAADPARCPRCNP